MRMQQPDEEIIDLTPEAISQVAKTKDAQKLNKFLGNGCVGIVKNQVSAIQLLAQEGDEQTVDFLLDKFNDNINQALVGAAQSANKKLMYKLLARGAGQHYALYGAVLGNHIELAKEILEKGPISIDLACKASGRPGLEHLYDLLVASKYSSAAKTDALEGAGIYGNKNLIDKSIQEGQSLTNAICGAASAGHFALVDNLLQHPSCITEPHATDMALLGAAIFGSDESIRKYTTDSKDIIALGLGQAGNAKLLHNYINPLLRENSQEEGDEKKDFLDAAIEAAAFGGHLELVNGLMQIGASPKRALRGAASGCHLSIINKLSSHLDDKTRDAMITNFRLSQIIKNNPEEMLRLASFINDEKLRNLFLDDALGLDKSLIEDPQKKEVLFKNQSKKARIYNKLMNEKNINYNQARAWNKVGLHAWLLRLPPEGELRTLPDTLPKELLVLIQSYISPLTQEELTDLVTKLKSDHLKIRKEGMFKKPPQSTEKTKPEKDSPETPPDSKPKP